MPHCDTLISTDWCIPVEPDGVVLSGQSVVVNDHRIEAILPTEEARQQYTPGNLIERPGHVLIPGLINAHTHAAMTLLRGAADDLPLERWLTEAIWPLEGRHVDSEFVRDGTRLAIAEMLLSGCTTFSDQYFFPEIVAETAAEAHMRAVVATPVIDVETAWASSYQECLDKGAELVHDAYADHPLVSAAFAPHSVISVSDDAFGALRVIADQLDSRVQIHLHESREEVEDTVKQRGRRPIDQLDELGLLNASLLAVHAVHLNASEIERFADRGIAVAHCPRSNLKLADGIAEVQRLLDAGVTVGLGTDGAASNNVLEMPGEMRTAALLAKACAERADALPASAALRVATLGSARALGLESQIGSIEVGKAADLTCIDLMRINCQPLYDPLSQVVYTTQPDQVTDVWVAGRHLVDNGRLTALDSGELIRRAGEWRQTMETGTATA